MDDPQLNQLHSAMASETNSNRRLDLFVAYGQRIINLDRLGEFDNYPWGQNDNDGFAHQSGAYLFINILVGLLLDWIPELQKQQSHQAEILYQIEDLASYLELPPQTDQEPRNPNHPSLQHREKDWQTIIQLIQQLERTSNPYQNQAV
jgi:hypothetical protein